MTGWPPNIAEDDGDGRTGYDLGMKDRHRTPLRMREQRATFQVIGEALGVTTSRARVIHQRAVVLQTEEAAGLHIRTIAILHGDPQRLDELAALAERDSDEATRIVIRLPNCSLASAKEIVAWWKAGNRKVP